MASAHTCAQFRPGFPIDYTVKKHILSVSQGDFTVEDAGGNTVFMVRGRYHLGRTNNLILLDSSGNPLLSIYQQPGLQGLGWDWECRRRNCCGYEEMVFGVKKRSDADKWVKELEIFFGLVHNYHFDGTGVALGDMVVKGSPFARSCTVYRGNSILAQCSALYKLGKAMVFRHKFRLTFYCDTIDHALIVALVAIFFSGNDWC